MPHDEMTLETCIREQTLWKEVIKLKYEMNGNWTTRMAQTPMESS